MIQRRFEYSLKFFQKLSRLVSPIEFVTFHGICLGRAEPRSGCLKQVLLVYVFLWVSWDGKIPNCSRTCAVKKNAIFHINKNSYVDCCSYVAHFTQSSSSDLHFGLAIISTASSRMLQSHVHFSGFTFCIMNVNWYNYGLAWTQISLSTGTKKWNNTDVIYTLAIHHK